MCGMWLFTISFLPELKQRELQLGSPPSTALPGTTRGPQEESDRVATQAGFPRHQEAQSSTSRAAFTPPDAAPDSHTSRSAAPYQKSISWSRVYRIDSTITEEGKEPVVPRISRRYYSE